MDSYYLDTNLLLRVLNNDNPRYKRNIQEFIQQATQSGHKLLISIEVICELEYALRKYYNRTKEETKIYLKSLLTENAFTIENQEIVALAIHAYTINNLDFIDNVLIAKSQVTTIPIVTLDKKLAQTNPNCKLL